MAGYGFGFGGRSGSRETGQDHLLVSWPSAAWTGAAGSGFATVPADPARTTAKPALRLIVPPNQFYTDSLLVGVFAAANHNGSLLDNLGLEKVIVHHEGTVVELPAPGFRTFADANGTLVTYYAWWIALRHDGRSGHAQVYFEAVPKDTTMQRRVIGPFQFSPAATLHDYDITVEPSQSELAGVRYPTPAKAIRYLRQQAAQNPRIRLMETATYSDWNETATYSGAGWLTVEAPAGVTATIGYPGYNHVSPPNMRTRYEGIRFRGANLVFDMRYMSQIYHENLRPHWLDGVRVINSGGAGYGRLWQGRTRPATAIVRDGGYMTECAIDGLSDPIRSQTLARGNTVLNGWNDLMSGTITCLGNTFVDGGNNFFQAEVPALRVRYTGAAATATLAIASRPISATRVVTVKVGGASIGTFTIASGTSDGIADTNYWVHNVAAWLNTLPDITASVLNDTMAAIQLGAPGVGDAATPDTNIKTAAVDFATRTYPHGDLYSSNGNSENLVIVANNSYGPKCDMQILTGTANGPLRDAIIANNCFVHPDQPGALWQVGAHPTFANSHAVFTHNSCPDYQLSLRTDQAGFGFDAYCLIANNVYESLGVNASYAARCRNNHTVSAPSVTMTGHSSGGSYASLFANASNGDFTPAGELLTNRKGPALAPDRGKRRRGGQDTPGALSAS